MSTQFDQSAQMPKNGEKTVRIPENLVITGPDGTDRVRLNADEMPGIVDVLDANGVLRARLCTAIAPNGMTPPGSAGLNIYNQNGALTARFGSYSPPLGGVCVLLRDNQERDRLMMSVAEDGTPSIRMMDENGVVIWQAP